MAVVPCWNREMPRAGPLQVQHVSRPSLYDGHPAVLAGLPSSCVLGSYGLIGALTETPRLRCSMTGSSSPGDSAPGLPSAAVLFLIWALLFYLARIWSKVGKNDRWGSDGTVISLAMVSLERKVNIVLSMGCL